VGTSRVDSGGCTSFEAGIALGNNGETAVDISMINQESLMDGKQLGKIERKNKIQTVLTLLRISL
jgi:hypothetical protein